MFVKIITFRWCLINQHNGITRTIESSVLYCQSIDVSIRQWKLIASCLKGRDKGKDSLRALISKDYSASSNHQGSIFTCTWGGIYPRRVEPASSREKHGDVSWVYRVPSPDVTAYIGFAAQAKLARPESDGESAFHTLLFGFIPVDATGTQGIGVWSAEVCWLHRHLDNFVGE